jgi:hypothetical protein
VARETQVAADAREARIVAADRVVAARGGRFVLGFGHLSSDRSGSSIAALSSVSCRRSL